MDPLKTSFPLRDLQRNEEGKNSRRGYLPAFSLMEVSFVLIIIGLLIGGIIKGRDMLENARLTALLQQINSYRLLSATKEDATGKKPTTWAEMNIRGTPSTRLGSPLELVEEGRRLKTAPITEDQFKRLQQKAGEAFLEASNQDIFWQDNTLYAIL